MTETVYSKVVIPNKYDIEYPWKIPLTQELYALVDHEDYHWLIDRKWHAREDGNTFYAFTRNEYSHDAMHILIAQKMGILTDIAKEVDHKNNNGLDNRRNNLRAATRAQNRANSSGSKPKDPNSIHTTKFIGVSHLGPQYKSKPYRAWLAGKHLGTYATAEEAAKAYDKAAREAYGEFARTNF